MTDRELMQQALDALVEVEQTLKQISAFKIYPKYYEAIEALRARLANEFNPDWDAMGVMVEEQQRMAKRIEELEAALAQPEQEPVAYDKTDLNAFVQNLYDVKMREGKHGHYETMFYVVQQTIKHVCGNKQPAAWLCKNKKSGGLFALTREQLTELGYGNISMPPFEKVAPLYTAPPQRGFIGLTDEEIMDICNFAKGQNGFFFVREIEAKLKEKNT